MSIKNPLAKEINELRHTYNNDFVMELIVKELANRIKQSPHVTATHKETINRYSKESCPVKPVCPPAASSPTLNLLIKTAIYYLTDLNIYDYHLVNYAMDYGLQPDEVITLLLLNNIYDVDIFCKQKGLIGSQYNNISTLKKLSALHKVQFNF